MTRVFIMMAILAAGLSWARPANEIDRQQRHQDRAPQDPRTTSGGATGGTRWTLGERPHHEARQQVLGGKGRVTLSSENAYEVQGELQRVEPEQNLIVISRDQLPPIALYVVDGSLIQREGEEVALNMLEPGDEVRANFNVAMTYPVAIDVTATR